MSQGLAVAPVAFTSGASLPSPYVGPRPFSRDHVLYGRDVAVRHLLDLLIAERIVLLHSPSRAGKTSLIQSALIPALEKDDFDVLPGIRVSRRAAGTADGGANRYVISTLLSL